MKKLVILLIAAMAFMMVGCFGDDGTTLGWTNKSDNRIANIEWRDTELTVDQNWNSGDTLLAIDDNTTMKSVNLLNGEFTCDVFDGDGNVIENSFNFNIGDTTNGDTETLVEDEANRFDVYATAK